MGIDFKIKEFAYPLSIWRLKNVFEKNQWLDERSLWEYQLKRLRAVLEQASQNVPYYQKLFRVSGVAPADIKTPEDLKAIPILTKDALTKYADALLARNARRYGPVLLTTSGTSGSQVRFYVDKPSNVLEFAHYWRFWGWAGYLLGNTFAELSAEYFTPFAGNWQATYHFDRVARRLLVNSLLISRASIESFVSAFKKYRPTFLKGLPSNLYMLALLLNERSDHGVKFRAIFSQGENLLEHQRREIEKAFSCKVFDAYGHMERTVAISQCPFGRYHVHSDYGVAEFVEPEIPVAGRNDDDSCVREVIGTSLYNFSMPLIRYKTGDLVVIKSSHQRCPCGRGFPVVHSIAGRSADIVITPDRRAVTALYVAFDRTPGIKLGQIVQDRLDRLLVRIAHEQSDRVTLEQMLKRNLEEFVGTSMDILIEHTTADQIRGHCSSKFKVVLSHVDHKEIFR